MLVERGRVEIRVPPSLGSGKRRTWSVGSTRMMALRPPSVIHGAHRARRSRRAAPNRRRAGYDSSCRSPDRASRARPTPGRVPDAAVEGGGNVVRVGPRGTRYSRTRGWSGRGARRLPSSHDSASRSGEIRGVHGGRGTVTAISSGPGISATSRRDRRSPTPIWPEYIHAGARHAVASGYPSTSSTEQAEARRKRPRQLSNAGWAQRPGQPHRQDREGMGPRRQSRQSDASAVTSKLANNDDAGDKCHIVSPRPSPSRRRAEAFSSGSGNVGCSSCFRSRRIRVRACRCPEQLPRRQATCLCRTDVEATGSAPAVASSHSSSALASVFFGRESSPGSRSETSGRR